MSQKFRAFQKHRIVDLINTLVDKPHYVFAGRHQSFVDDTNPPPVTDSVQSEYQVRDEMLFGKRVTSADVIGMCRRVDYDLSGQTVYDIYDDTDPDLASKNYYVITRDRNVYKCLGNNNGMPSTSEPQDVDPSGTIVLADGYMWKYMYTVPAEVEEKFDIPGFMPIVPNANVAANATTGVYSFRVTDAGSGYSTYATGQVLQSSQNTSATILRVSPELPAANNFFDGCAFYATTGTGAGQHHPVSLYVSNTSGRFVVLGQTGLASQFDATTRFLLAPNVVLHGNGSGFKGYLMIDPVSNTATGVWVVNPGEGYSFATPQIVANFGSGAVIHPVMPPVGGHGSDPSTELPASTVGVSVSFVGNQTNTIPTELSFRTVGLCANLEAYNSPNHQLYTDLTFNNTWDVTVTMPGGQPFGLGETVSTSTGVTAEVVYATTTRVILANVRGSLSPLQVLTGQSTGLVGSIQALNTPDVDKYTGDLLYATNITPVQRSQTSTETVRLTFNL